MKKTPTVDVPEAEAPAPKPGTREWLKAKIAEHRAQQSQALGFANAQAGAADAYERLLSEMEAETTSHGAP